MDAATRQYDAWATIYDALWRRYSERTIDALLARAELRRGDRILDVGCGTGAFEEKLLARNEDHTIVGLDASANMLARARRKLPAPANVSFVEGKAEHLPFGDSSFDVVVSASTLHYVENAAAAVREMRRVLRPDGRVFLLDWSRDFLSMRLWDAVLRLIEPAHARTYAADEVRDMMVHAELRCVRLETFRVGAYGLFFAAASV